MKMPAFWRDLVAERPAPTPTALLLTGLVGALVYLPTIFFEFAFDDRARLVENPSIRSLGFMLSYFSEPGWPGDLYRPLEPLSFALTHALFGLNPLPYHLTNVALHGAVCVALLLALSAVYSTRVALIAAILFAVHGAHVEAVSSIGYRTELMGALGGFASLYFAALALRAGTGNRVWFSGLQAVAFFAALLSKESACSFLLLTPFYLFFLKPDWSAAPGRLRNKQIVFQMVPAALVFALYLGIRFAIFGSLMQSPSAPPEDNQLVLLSGLPRALNALVFLGKYLRLCLVPFPLHSTYGFAELLPVTDWTEGRTLSDLLLFGLAAAGTAILLVRRDSLAFAGCLFFGAMAVTSNVLFPIGVIFGDRLVYAGSAGICIVAAGIVDTVLRQYPTRIAATAGVFALYLLMHTSIVLYEAQFWRNNQTRFAREAVVSPNSAVARLNHGYQLHLQKRYADAISEYEASLKILPNNAKAWRGLVYTFQATGDREATRRALTAVLKFEPSNEVMLAILAEEALREGNRTEAELAAKRALAVDPNNVAANEVLQRLRAMPAAAPDTSGR